MDFNIIILIYDFWQKKRNGSYFCLYSPFTSLASPQQSFALDFWKTVLARHASLSESYQHTYYTQRNRGISQQATQNFNSFYSRTWNNLESVSVHSQKAFCSILDSRNHGCKKQQSTLWSRGSHPWESLLPRGQLATSGGLLVVAAWESVTGTQSAGPAMLCDIFQYTGRAHTLKCQ